MRDGHSNIEGNGKKCESILEEEQSDLLVDLMVEMWRRGGRMKNQNDS